MYLRQAGLTCSSKFCYLYCVRCRGQDAASEAPLERKYSRWRQWQSSFCKWTMNNFYIKDGHLFFRKTGNISDILGDRLVINPHTIDKTIDYINSNDIKTITINPSKYIVNDLGFLTEINSIEGLYLLQNNLDLSPINELKNLRVLHADKLDSKIDFNNFPNLQVLGTTYNKSIDKIKNCKKLFWLWLDSFKQENLDMLSELSDLMYLHLYKTTIVDLKGIEKLKKLVELYIDGATKLQSLSGLTTSNLNLEFIDIYNAKRLTDYGPLSSVKNVKRLIFVKTGDGEYLEFINELNNLEELVIGNKQVVKNRLRLSD
jgi:hypothetical protein